VAKQIKLPEGVRIEWMGGCCPKFRPGVRISESKCVCGELLILGKSVIRHTQAHSSVSDTVREKTTNEFARIGLGEDRPDDVLNYHE